MSYIKATALTPHATDEQPFVDAILVGSGGTLACRFRGDDADITLTGLEAGKVYPFQLKYIRISGTSAGSLIGLTGGRIVSS